MKKLGTAWVASGDGATIDELWHAIPSIVPPGGKKALDHLDKLGRENGIMGKCNIDHETNLTLTGEPLTKLDLYRIETCE